MADIQNILRNCIEYNTKILNRRNITIKALSKEFEITELKKEIKDLVGNIVINDTKVRNVYNPQNVKLEIKGTNPPKEIIVPLELPPAPIEVEPLPIKPLPIKPTPIKVIEPTPEPQPKPIQDVIPTPSYGSGGGGSSNVIYDGRNFDGGMGRDNAYLSDANSTQRENIQ